MSACYNVCECVVVLYDRKCDDSIEKSRERPENNEIENIPSFPPRVDIRARDDYICVYDE